MILTEIVLGKTDDEKKKVIEDYIGKQIILKDSHLNWQHVVITDANGSLGRYKVVFMNARPDSQLCYNDLKQLIEIKY